MIRHLTCPICGKEFDTEHNKQKYCSKDCSKIAKAKREKQWREDNHEHFLEWQREHRKEYYKHNPEKFKESSKRYYLKHREKVLARQKKYYWEHRDERIEHGNNYYQNTHGAIYRCKAKHNDCFSCPTEDGECLYD